ncbi:aryl-alcohol dehydrogenase-like predicted oxidoreductase [Winogradskyella pacifica]|uniref:Aryl-alcohol dehydrogenase-like predicted oxidoreductase n=1 Tax=Winogradskyella pacifica TaxID=664642 RepID=A0A3D9N540_9FLAO|nr:aldo/keto reductase [Winogradskyella pacifica]REE27194.1 aryl-alcohol dehydrogenase-like predicted oxidoreductase [Winogradskyella pacifica]
MSNTKIGLGLAALGRPDYINIRPAQNIDKSIESFRTNALKVLDESYALGIRDFDVAPSYGLGEQFLQNWNDSRNHKDVHLSTKFGYTYVANWEVGFSGKHEIKEHSIEKLNEQWDVSKALLPNLKIYQIHSATLDSGVLTNDAVLSRLNELKQEHQLKIGISSSGTEQVKIIEEARKVSFNGEDLFDSYQVTFNIFEQSTFEILKELLAQDKTVIIKEALANGRIFKNDTFPAYKYSYDYLETLSKKYNVNADAIAIRFIMDSLEPSLILSGASSTNQLQQNLKAFNLKLEADEILKLKSLTVDPQDYWQERSDLSWN